MGELIDQEVDYEHGLEEPKTLQLGPSFHLLVVAYDSPNHRVHHQGDLQADPSVLEYLSEIKLGLLDDIDLLVTISAHFLIIQ